MSYQDILRTAQTFEAVGLVGSSARRALKKKKKARDFIAGAAEITIGANLIKAQGEFI